MHSDFTLLMDCTLTGNLPEDDDALRHRNVEFFRYNSVLNILFICCLCVVNIEQLEYIMGIKTAGA